MHSTERVYTKLRFFFAHSFIFFHKFHPHFIYIKFNEITLLFSLLLPSPPPLAQSPGVSNAQGVEGPHFLQRGGHWTREGEGSFVALLWEKRKVGRRTRKEIIEGN